MSVAIASGMDESEHRPSPAPAAREQRRPGQSGVEQRSGDFSRDPTFDPAELFDVIEREDSVDHVLAAMREFEQRGEGRLFARGVALFARSARARGESVETVLGALEKIADELERAGQPGFAQRETPLRHLVLRGVLLAFYGADAVRREDDARRERSKRQRGGPGVAGDAPTLDDEGELPDSG